MAKAEKPKQNEKPKKTTDKEQSERFKATARELGIDDSSRDHFDEAFRKIVPQRRASRPEEPLRQDDE